MLMAASICLLLTLPLYLSAQPKTNSNWNIEINNGDTVVNGKPIAELSDQDRKSALSVLDDGNLYAKNEGEKGPRRVRVFRSESTQRNNDQVPALKRAIVFSKSGKDSQAFRFSRKNPDGSNASVHYFIGDASDEDYHKFSGQKSGVKKASFEVSMSVLFNEGTTSLALSPDKPGKFSAEWKTEDGKTVWAEKANEKLEKTFDTPESGRYFLVLKQGDAVSVKEISKD